MKRVFDDLGYLDGELSILFTDDVHMTELNRRYLGKEGPTNVLAFPMMEKAEPFSAMLGDVVISVDTVAREAAEIGETLEESIERLLVHGILHLVGFDHERSGEDALNMEMEEQRLLRRMRRE